MSCPRLDAHSMSSSSWFMKPVGAAITKSVISLTFCVSMTVSVQAQDTQKNASDESWTKTSESADKNSNPSRTTESHTTFGTRTVDKQKLEVIGTNGRYQPSLETETETVQVNDTTTRTVVRSYRWDGNGQRTLTQVTQEESRTAASGAVRVERKTSNADGNGNLQVVQREIVDTKK